MFRTTIRTFCFAALILVAIGSLSAADGHGTGKMNFEFDFGKYTPETDSEVFDTLSSYTDFNEDDFDGNNVQFKLLYQSNNRFQIGVGYSHFEQSQTLADLDFVDTDGNEILSDVNLKTNWVGFNGLWAPFGWGNGKGDSWQPRLFVPYLSFGGGFKSWDFSLEGETVEMENGSPVIVPIDSSSDGIAFVGKIGCGVRFNLHEKIDFNFGLEKEVGEDDLGEEFSDEDLDLGGSAAYIGVVIRL